ncbi:MAG: hypothetical protein Q8S73_19325 [Deltaproteobacteria bacterium]|nr:hypothetical protein [Myxococcales bacterium]MDP3216269.1 hypothetical protein [Deltaproteobacteria bacterium]
MPRRPTTALLLFAAGATGCAAAPRCATAPAGAVVRWADLSLDPAARINVVPVLAQAPAGFDPSAETVHLRFDGAALGEAPVVDRAALVLVPAPGARPERCALLRVRAVDEPWTVAAVNRGDTPALGLAAAAEVTLPPQRVPVRVDVTALVRALGAEGLTRRGLAVTATEGGATFQGSGTLSPAERPRLEVLLR